MHKVPIKQPNHFEVLQPDIGHIEVADGAKVQAQSGVAAPIRKENTAVYGSPAVTYANYLKSYAVFKQLPDLHKKIRALEKQLKELEKINKKF